MQKKIKSRYINKITHKEYNLRYLPYGYYLEENGICAFINVKKNNNL